MSVLATRVLQFIRSEQLIQRDSILLLGVSGGPDSVCLLHVMASLKETLGVTLHVAHLDHMMRGADSADDARYVADLAGGMGIPATVERRDVLAYRKKHRLSLEVAARRVRYEFYADVAASVGAKRVALGHTRDDQVETILMHLIRGSSLSGLRGMRPIVEWRYADGYIYLVRPLLGLARNDTEEYCRSHALEPREDMSNYSTDFLRNRLRWELIPLLRQYNPGINGSVLRCAQAVADDYSFLEEQVSTVWGEVVSEHPEGVLLHKTALRALHPSLQRHLLRRVLGKMLGDLTDVQWVHIERMREGLGKAAGKSISLPRGLILHVGYETCLLTRVDSVVCPLSPIEGEYKLNIPGCTAIPGWKVETKIGPPERTNTGFRACFDIDRSGTDLLVRRRKAGDRFHPLGMSDTKKLQDFMVDVKIPQLWRDRVPLVCSIDSILWVVGWRIAEGVKVKDSTKQALHLHFERLS